MEDEMVRAVQGFWIEINRVPLAACQTIRAEAKIWPFENRFWLI
jgi:hypothetical protein